MQSNLVQRKGSNIKLCDKSIAGKTRMVRDHKVSLLEEGLLF